MSENTIHAGLGEDNNISAEGDLYYTIVNMMEWLISHKQTGPYSIISTPRIWKLAHIQLWKYLPIDYRKINEKERDKLKRMMKTAYNAIMELEEIREWKVSLDLKKESIILTNGIVELITGELDF